MVSNFKDFPPFIQHFSPQFIPLIGSFRKVAVNLPVTGPTTAPSHHQPPIQPLLGTQLRTTAVAFFRWRWCKQWRVPSRTSKSWHRKRPNCRNSSKMPVVGRNAWWTWEGEWDEKGIYWNMSCVLCGLGATSLEDCRGDFNSWYLSGWWFGTCFITFHILGIIIIPIDELHHFSEG